MKKTKYLYIEGTNYYLTCCSKYVQILPEWTMWMKDNSIIYHTKFMMANTLLKNKKNCNLYQQETLISGKLHKILKLL